MADAGNFTRYYASQVNNKDALINQNAQLKFVITRAARIELTIANIKHSRDYKIVLLILDTLPTGNENSRFMKILIKYINYKNTYHILVYTC